MATLSCQLDSGRLASVLCLASELRDLGVISRDQRDAISRQIKESGLDTVERMLRSAAEAALAARVRKNYIFTL